MMNCLLFFLWSFLAKGGKANISLFHKGKYMQSKVIWNNPNQKIRIIKDRLGLSAK